MSTIGAKDQFNPSAAPSLHAVSPIRYPFSGLFVAATAIGLPNDVPSSARPSPPASVFAANRSGISENS